MKNKKRVILPKHWVIGLKRKATPLKRRVTQPKPRVKEPKHWVPATQKLGKTTQIGVWQPKRWGRLAKTLGRLAIRWSRPALGFSQIARPIFAPVRALVKQRQRGVAQVNATVCQNRREGFSLSSAPVELRMKLNRSE